jgi:WD repeat-containing protein 45
MFPLHPLSRSLAFSPFLCVAAGILALSPTGAGVLACPGLNPGYVHVEHLDTDKTHMIPAHDNPIAQIQLSVDGTLLATASDKGTLIRLFSTETGTQLHELRRGIDKALIYGISFNLSNSMLCVTSDKGTVHIFSLLDESSMQRNTKENARST